MSPFLIETWIHRTPLLSFNKYLLSVYYGPGTEHTVGHKTDKIISLIKLGEADKKQIHNRWIMLPGNQTIKKNKAGKGKKELEVRVLTF